MTMAYDPMDLAVIEDRISAWLRLEMERNPIMVAVDRGEADERRWYVRLAGEDKDFTTIWLTLGQRTLAYETYVMPAPEENAVVLYENLLRRNLGLVGVQFAIGAEDAVFLVGSLPLTGFDEGELDRLVGTVYATVERCFRALLRIGFESRFSG